jgi:hypothetical protein
MASKLEEGVEIKGEQYPCWLILHIARQTVVLGGERPKRLMNQQSSTHRALVILGENFSIFCR